MTGTPQPAQHAPQPVDTLRQLNPTLRISLFDCRQEGFKISGSDITDAIEINSWRTRYVFVKQAELIACLNLFKKCVFLHIMRESLLAKTDASGRSVRGHDPPALFGA